MSAASPCPSTCSRRRPSRETTTGRRRPGPVHPYLVENVFSPTQPCRAEWQCWSAARSDHSLMDSDSLTLPALLAPTPSGPDSSASDLACSSGPHHRDRRTSSDDSSREAGQHKMWTAARFRKSLGKRASRRAREFIFYYKWKGAKCFSLDIKMRMEVRDIYRFLRLERNAEVYERQISRITDYDLISGRDAPGASSSGLRR